MSPPPPSFVPWSVRECQAFDRYLQEEIGLPAALLMENAGAGLAREALRRAWEEDLHRILVLAGPGNNGGDGLVAARQLWERIPVEIHFPLGPPRPEPARGAWAAAQAVGVPLAPKPLSTALSRPGWLVVDALFGIGLAREIQGAAAEALLQVRGSGHPVLAADLPSGLDGDRGEVLGTALRARWTLSFVAPKRAFTSPTGAAFAGEITLAPIGVSKDFAEAWRATRGSKSSRPGEGA